MQPFLKPSPEVWAMLLSILIHLSPLTTMYCTYKTDDWNNIEFSEGLGSTFETSVEDRQKGCWTGHLRKENSAHQDMKVKQLYCTKVFEVTCHRIDWSVFMSTWVNFLKKMMYLCNSLGSCHWQRGLEKRRSEGRQYVSGETDGKTMTNNPTPALT